MSWDDDVDLDDLWQAAPPHLSDPADGIAALAPEPASGQPSDLDVIACRVASCRSPDLRLKSTEPETGTVKFVCRGCGATTTKLLPHGYRQVFICVRPPPP